MEFFDWLDRNRGWGFPEDDVSIHDCLLIMSDGRVEAYLFEPLANTECVRPFARKQLKEKI